MKRLEADACERLERLSPVVYAATGPSPGFVFDIDPSAGRLVGFFLSRARGELAPRIFFDEGDGFSDVNTLVLKSFPFAFYHVSRERKGGLRRLRFEPCEAGDATFRFLAFQTSSGILVAILHYLFNLRYQKVPLVAGDPKARGRLASWKASLARIVKFFGDVSKGGGMRVQQGAQNMLPMLRSWLVLEAAAVEAEMSAALGLAERPLISFVTPTYNTSETFLRDLVDSFTLQKAAYAELILSDDGSPDPAMAARLAVAEQKPGVRVVRNETNRGIAAATNAGIAAARGRWISLVDHDDVLVSGAIAVIAKAIQDHPDAVFFYTDELIVDAALKPLGEFCKPAYDSVLLSGMNYINHLSIYRADRLAEVGALREDREGSQDYDLLLRYLAGAAPGSIIHIPYLAYLWRRETASYSLVNAERSVGSARLALAAAYGHEGVPVVVEPATMDPRLHRVRLPRPTPLVTIVIPNRDSPALIKRIVADIREKTDYPRVEIVIVDNGSVDPVAPVGLVERQHGGIVVDIKPEPFNFAAMCNRGARLGKGEAILFLNNDIEVPSGSSGWLAEMVECIGFAATGIVGAKLDYPSGRIQHAGVIAGLGNAAGHWNIEAPTDAPGPMGRLFVRQTLSAVTGACMLVSRPCFEALGGFDEESFAVAYNDIDFCLRAKAAGVRTVWTPFARLIHHESLTRGSDEHGAQNERFRRETHHLQARHGTTTLIDDAYSPFYDRRYSDPTIVTPDALPAPRPGRLP
jgi:O-antigen biosynthesis protein